MADDIERYLAHMDMLETSRIQQIRQQLTGVSATQCEDCLLYTSDAADE